MILLTNIKRLYDGTSSRHHAVHERVDLALEDGKVLWIRPHDPRRETGEQMTVIDASTYVVVPGIVDCHGHITVLGLGSKDMDRSNSVESLVYVEKILHGSLVRGGVTTMRDVGGATHLMKRLVDDGTWIGPRLKISICMLSTTGGHADFRGPDRCHADISKLWPPGPGRPSSVVDGALECRKRVREIAACGADLIKICTSPGVASPSDKLEHQDFTPEEIQAICEEARARGLKVAAHAHSKSGIELAIQNGVSDIQHISFMDQRLVEKAYDKGCTVTPTSWVLSALIRAEGLSPFVMEKVKQVNEVHQRAVQHARSGGLKILAGTDPVLPGMHGRNYMEITHLMKDGLDPLEAWHSATGLAADEIGQTDAGALAPGKRADLLVCTEDVIQRPESMDQGALLEVIKDGVGYRGGLRAIPQKTFENTVDSMLGFAGPARG